MFKYNLQNYPAPRSKVENINESNKKSVKKLVYGSYLNNRFINKINSLST